MSVQEEVHVLYILIHHLGLLDPQKGPILSILSHSLCSDAQLHPTDGHFDPAQKEPKLMAVVEYRSWNMTVL